MANLESEFVQLERGRRVERARIERARPLRGRCLRQCWQIVVRRPEIAQARRQLAGPAAQRFDGLSILRSDAGAMLFEDEVATFDCRIFSEVGAGDKTMVLLQLQEVNETAAASHLVFHRSSFGRIAG